MSKINDLVLILMCLGHYMSHNHSTNEIVTSNVFDSDNESYRELLVQHNICTVMYSLQVTIISLHVRVIIRFLTFTPHHMYTVISLHPYILYAIMSLHVCLYPLCNVPTCMPIFSMQLCPYRYTISSDHHVQPCRSVSV